MNRFWKRLRFGIPILLLVTMAVSLVPSMAQGRAGTTLKDQYVTATAHWTKTFGWTISKTVEPDTLDMFRGDTGSVEYTIEVTKDGGTTVAYIEGQVCGILNGGAEATENLAIVANVFQPPAGPSSVLVASSVVDVSSNPVLNPGEIGCYDYSVTIPSPVAGATYKVSADITITNHSGHLGVPFGPSPDATVVFPSAPTLVNDSINVDDSNGGSWPFSASGSVGYSKDFTCDEDAGEYDNTATIRETGQSSTATVTVNCYELEVTKDASTSLDRTYHWSIDKSVNESSVTLSTGQTYLVNYTVVVDVTGTTDDNWAVTGNIDVHNPAPIDATLNSVSDVISDGINASVDCGVSFPTTLAAGDTLSCTYESGLPNASSRTNTATATLQNTPGGTTDFTGTALVSFSNASVNLIDETVDVSDTFAGALGSLTAGVSSLPATFTYSRTIGGYETCGDRTVDNTATFVTNDTQTSGSDSESVAVTVPCNTGCTLTQGYWKTHSSYGPAPYDDTWALLPNGANTLLFDTGKSWYTVFRTPPAGNAFYNLAHQYMAAVLNQLNGATVPPAVQTVMNQAAALLNSYDGNPNAMSKITGGVKAQFLSAASALDNYNNGNLGVPHCSE